MRVFAVVRLLVIFAFAIVICTSLNAQQMISSDTKKIEEQMAVVNAGRAVSADDTTVLRFRFLLSALSLASGDTPREVGDKIHTARRVLREEFGKDVGLLNFTEAAYKARAALQRKQFDKYIAQMVILMGAS